MVASAAVARQRQSPRRKPSAPPNVGSTRGNFSRNDNNRPDFNHGSDRRDLGHNDNLSRGPGLRGGPRPDYTQYQRAFKAPHRYRFRGPVNYRPPGWYYRRWTFGDFLPALFWEPDYWVNGYAYYDLMPLPGTVWVRYDNDALLIDLYTGEVI
jgi:Ni/Co efflux regulator RcnB